MHSKQKRCIAYCMLTQTCCNHLQCAWTRTRTAETYTQRVQVSTVVVLQPMAAMALHKLHQEVSATLDPRSVWTGHVRRTPVCHGIAAACQTSPTNPGWTRRDGSINLASSLRDFNPQVQLGRCYKLAAAAGSYCIKCPMHGARTHSLHCSHRTN